MHPGRVCAPILTTACCSGVSGSVDTRTDLLRKIWAQLKPRREIRKGEKITGNKIGWTGKQQRNAVR